MLKITAFRDCREFSPADRRKRLSALKENTFDAVRIPFRHAAMEPAPRRYDFTEGEEIFQEAAEAGLKVIPSFCFQTPPWLSSAEPEELRKCRCLFLERAARQFRTKRNLAFFYLPPEPSGETIAPSDSAFRAWLMLHYPSMQALNRALAANFQTPEDITCEYAAAGNLRMRVLLAEFTEEFAETRKFLFRKILCESAEPAKAVFRTISVKPSHSVNRILAKIALQTDDFLIRAEHWTHTAGGSSADLSELLLSGRAGNAAGIEWADRNPLPKPCGVLEFPADNPPAYGTYHTLLGKCLPKEIETPADAIQIRLLRSVLSDALYQTFDCGNLHRKSFRRWNKALSDASLPHTVLPEDAEIPEETSLLIVPSAAALKEKTTERLLAFAHRGGLLFCEGDCGHYGDSGNYLEPERRFLAEAAGIPELPRIKLPSGRLKCTLDGKTFFLHTETEASPRIPVRKWTETISDAPDGNALFLSVRYGKGRLLLCAPRFARPTLKSGGMEPLIPLLLSAAGVRLPFRILRTPGNDIPILRFTGNRMRRQMILFLPKSGAKCEIEFEKDFWNKRILTDLTGGAKVPLEPSANGFLRLKWKPQARRTVVLSE